MQYEVYFNTTNVLESPVLKNVSIYFNGLPFTLSYKPENRSILSYNKPKFIWNFIDFDSSVQAGFQVLIDNNSNFINVNFDSGEQESSNQTWQFPNGTGYSVIPDGTWYWKVRTMDEDGDWSDYTQPWKIIIDTIAPASVTSTPENNTAYNKLNKILGTASDPVKSSGLSKVEISIQRLNDTFYWDGAAWSAGENWLLTSGTADWNYDTNSVAWSSGTRYTVRSRAADIATNVESPAAGNTFIIDLDKPHSTIDIPINDTYLNELNKIAGRAFDTGKSELNQVEINIMRNRDHRHWNGTTWISTPAWLTAGGTAEWFYDSSTVIWESDTRYIVRSKASDNVMNIEVPGAGKIFYIDLDLPSSTIEFPTNNSFLNRLDLISGIAQDKGGSDISKIKISIKRTTDKKYWNGTTWTLTESWLLVDGTTEWSYDTSKVIWTSDSGYLVRSRAEDHATNVEIPSYGKRFSIDLDIPTSTIEFPVNNTFLRKIQTISGKAVDVGGSSLYKIQLSLKRISDDNYWTGDHWGLNESWFTTAGTDSWLYVTRGIEWTTDKNYNLRSRAIDNAGNMGVPGSGITFMYDNEPPEPISISINEDDLYTNSIEVVLSLQAEDSGSGVYQMAFNIEGIIWSAWEEFEASRTFVLPEKDGTKYVYFQVKDRAENIAKYVFDHIILDTTPPDAVSILINENATYTNTTHVNLNLNAVDPLSGINNMSFSSGGSKWTPWEPYQIIKFTSLSTGDREKIILFRVNDNAGNIGLAYDTIILDTEPPHSLIIYINNDEPITNFTSVTLELSATDDTSGVYQMSFNTDGDNWSDWEDYANTKSLILQSDDGEKKVYFKVKDRAGNIAEHVEDSITMVTALPDPNPHDEEPSIKQYFESNLPFILVLIIILINISLFIVAYYHRMKKRKLQEELSKQERTDIPSVSQPIAPLIQAAPVQPALTQNVDVTTIQPFPVPGATSTPALIPAPVLTIPAPIPAAPQAPQLPAAQILTETMPPKEDGVQDQTQNDYPTHLELPGDGTKETAQTQTSVQEPPQAQSQLMPCPLCQQQIAAYSNPCPQCGGALNWGDSK